MKFPEKIPIERIEDYHTHYIGKYGDGEQFFGYETFIFTKPYGEIQKGDNWQKYRKEYVVLYLFNEEGDFKGAKYWYGGTIDIVNEEEMTAKLEEMIAQLGKVNYCDIEVKPFKTEIDGHIFGLIPDEETEMINLEPSSTISFMEPWDGGYDT